MQEEQKNEDTQLGVGSAAKFSEGKTRRKDERNGQGAGKKHSPRPHHESEGTCCETLGTRKTC